MRPLPRQDNLVLMSKAVQGATRMVGAGSLGDELDI